MKRVRYVGVPDPMIDRRKRKTVEEQLALYREDEAAGIPHENRRGITQANVWDVNVKRLGGNQETGPTAVVAAMPYVTVRILDKTVRYGKREEEVVHFSKRLVWGPKPDQMIQEVTNADWEAIQRLPEASHWKLVEDGPADEPDADTQPDSPAEG